MSSTRDGYHLDHRIDLLDFKCLFGGNDSTLRWIATHEEGRTFDSGHYLAPVGYAVEDVLKNPQVDSTFRLDQNAVFEWRYVWALLLPVCQVGIHCAILEYLNATAPRNPKIA